MKKTSLLMIFLVIAIMFTSIPIKAEGIGEEVEWDAKNQIAIIGSHYLEENSLTQEEALQLANDFIKKYVDENIELILTPDLFPSLYEEETHETYGDNHWKHIVVVDLEYGCVEYYGLIDK